MHLSTIYVMPVYRRLRVIIVLKKKQLANNVDGFSTSLFLLGCRLSEVIRR
jgi:hypothetical protein